MTVPKSTLVLSIALVASLGAAGWLWRELQSEHGRTAELSARLNSLAAVQTPAADRPAGIRPDPLVTPGSAAVAAPAETAAGADTEEWESRQRRLMKDPRYREAYRETRSVQLGKFRRDAIRLLGLTAKEADAVIGLMVDRQMRDIAEPTPYVNVTPDGLQQLKEQTENRERTYQDEIRARIGEDKRARWQTYLDSLGSRRLVEMLRAQLPDTDALRDDQVEPLISALHVEAAQYEREFAELNETVLSESDTADQMRRYQEHKMALMTANNHRQHVAASAILSTAQLRLLDEALQRELDREQADQRAALIADKLDKQASPPGQ